MILYLHGVRSIEGTRLARGNCGEGYKEAAAEPYLDKGACRGTVIGRDDQVLAAQFHSMFRFTVSLKIAASNLGSDFDVNAVLELT